MYENCRPNLYRYLYFHSDVITKLCNRAKHAVLNQHAKIRKPNRPTSGAVTSSTSLSLPPLLEVSE